MLDIKKIREEFPITKQFFKIFGSDEPRNLIYFDHGASTHPPQRVMDRYINFLEHYYSNVHRGKHFLSLISTELFDSVYRTISDFIHAEQKDNSIVLTSNTTTALDICASVMSGLDGITLVSLMEHHSNDLPHRNRGKVIHFGLNPDGSIDLNDLEMKLKNNKVKLVAVTAASNVTGFLPDLYSIAKLSHKYGARVLVDAAQILAHKEIDVKPNNDDSHIDFLAAAGHKAYAPFGSAFLFGPKEIFDNAKPYIPGGGTVLYVTTDDVYFNKSPDRHQGGTPNIGGAIALAEALNFLTDIGLGNIRKHEIELTKYAFDKLETVRDIKILGNIPLDKRLGVISFNIGEFNNNFVATVLNYEAAIATRNGCFCAHPYLHFLLGLKDTTELKEKLVRGEDVELPGAVRISIGIYNTKEEIDEIIRMLDIIANKKWKANYDNTNIDLVCKELVVNLF